MIVAPNPDGFSARFPDFAGTLFDASGALSNGGERITLATDFGATVFSFAYDDGASWPQAADGAGASLELAGPSLALDDGNSWIATDPNPGRWRFLPVFEPGTDPGDPTQDPAQNPTYRVPAPGGTALMALGLALMKLRRRCFRA